MRYMLMVYDNETRWTEPTPEEMGLLMADFDAFHADIMARGNLITADRLHPTPTATTLRLREGKALITDGPFAETKEQLGGVYVFECKDLDEALEIASKIPTVKTGSIEIRPVFLPPDEAQ